MAVHVGSVLAGRYEITAPIASGGMGEVWQALDRTLGRTVAAKVLRAEYTSDPSFLIRFRNEARHTAALSHPNIASVYDYGESTQDGQRVAYLVMEYVEGKPLVTVLAELGRLTPAQTLDVVGQAAEGLSAAHAAGMVHRDIKPGNLIVRPDGVVKLTDFGIARARDAAPLTRTGMVVGTAQYLSPEQAQGFPVTAASDVYSLGVLAFECLAGSRPFDGESQVAIALAQINRPPPPLPPDVPGRVRALVERCLAKDPAHRFADGAAVAAAVHSVARGGNLPPLTGTTRVPSDIGESTTVIPAQAAPAPETGRHTAPRTMPPLAGPPVGGGDSGRYDLHDDGYDDGYDDLDGDEPVRRRRLLWVLAGVLLLAGLGVAAAIALAGGGAPGGRQDNGATASNTPVVVPSVLPTTPPATTTAAGFFVDTSAYVGQDVDEVKKLLEAAGLKVEKKEATQAQLAEITTDLAKDAVVTTDPTEEAVPAESVVTLYFTKQRVVQDDAEEVVPTTRAPATTTSPAATTTTPPPETTKPTETSTEPTETSTEPSSSSSSSSSSSPSETSTKPSSSASAPGPDNQVVPPPGEGDTTSVDTPVAP